MQINPKSHQFNWKNLLILAIFQHSHLHFIYHELTCLLLSAPPGWPEIEGKFWDGMTCATKEQLQLKLNHDDPLHSQRKQTGTGQWKMVQIWGCREKGGQNSKLLGMCDSLLFLLLSSSLFLYEFSICDKYSNWDLSLWFYGACHSSNRPRSLVLKWLNATGNECHLQAPKLP